MIKKFRLFLFLLINLIILQNVYSSEIMSKSYYVSEQGEDSNLGSLESPFRTIQKAVDTMKAGDTCYIREGRYHEAINFDNLQGEEGSPIRILAYNNERVVIDGSEKITSKWEKHRGNIYKTKVKKDIWQLFVDDEAMSSAK